MKNGINKGSKEVRPQNGKAPERVKTEFPVLLSHQPQDSRQWDPCEAGGWHEENPNNTQNIIQMLPPLSRTCYSVHL